MVYKMDGNRYWFFVDYPHHIHFRNWIRDISQNFVSHLECHVINENIFRIIINLRKVSYLSSWLALRLQAHTCDGQFQARIYPVPAFEAAIICQHSKPVRSPNSIIAITIYSSLTHLSLDKMAAISQTTFSNAFS